MSRITASRICAGARNLQNSDVMSLGESQSSSFNRNRMPLVKNLKVGIFVRIRLPVRRVPHLDR